MNLALVFEHAPKRAPKRRLPVAVVSQPCAEPGCKDRFVLPYEAPLNALFECANFAGWTRHPHDRYGLLCPAHPYRYPVAEIEAPSVDRRTRPFRIITEEAS